MKEKNRKPVADRSTPVDSGYFAGTEITPVESGAIVLQRDTKARKDAWTYFLVDGFPELSVKTKALASVPDSITITGLSFVARPKAAAKMTPEEKAAAAAAAKEARKLETPAQKAAKAAGVAAKAQKRADALAAAAAKATA